jgi:glycosyltransferase involved in cell wall biosynthesis
MVVTVHEAYVPAIGWRDTLMGLWQRAQLYSLLLSSDAVIATCSERKEQVRALRLSTPLSHVPVGSNLDDITDVTGCAELRVQLRGTRIRPVVATFGNDHPSRLLSLLDRALSSLAETLGDFVVLNLGASAPHLRAPAGVEVIRPGPLTSQELSLHLACADLVLLPFSKGAITNKTALMAALQLGRPVLSTRGLCTDHVLLDPGLRLVDVGDADGYAAEAVALMRDQAQRDALGEHGRALYQRAFSWQVIAKQTLQALGLSGAKAFDSSTVGGEVPLDDRIP